MKKQLSKRKINANPEDKACCVGSIDHYSIDELIDLISPPNNPYITKEEELRLKGYVLLTKKVKGKIIQYWATPREIAAKQDNQIMKKQPIKRRIKRNDYAKLEADVKRLDSDIEAYGLVLEKIIQTIKSMRGVQTKIVDRIS